MRVNLSQQRQLVRMRGGESACAFRALEGSATCRLQHPLLSAVQVLRSQSAASGTLG
jgi:hypothetical protein